MSHYCNNRRSSYQAVEGTLLYLGLYFLCLSFQSFSKYYILAKKKEEAKGKDSNQRVSFKTIKYYSHDKMALRGDRTVGNYIEQGFCYLPLFWMHALFVDPSHSFAISATYTASRLLYPFLFGSKQGMILILSTFPGYVVNIYLLVALLREVAFA